MKTVEVLVIQPFDDEALECIAAVDPRLKVVDARGWFDDEIRDHLATMDGATLPGVSSAL